MILEIINWGFFVIVVIFFIHAVIWNIISLFNDIKKYRFIKQNWSPENYFKYFCSKYYDIEVPTEEDIQLLRDYLKKLKNQQ